MACSQEKRKEEEKGKKNTDILCTKQKTLPEPISIDHFTPSFPRYRISVMGVNFFT